MIYERNIRSLGKTDQMILLIKIANKNKENSHYFKLIEKEGFKES